MNETINGKKVVTEYNSIGEFYDYLCKTPFNEVFRWNEHHSVSGNMDFTKTANFEEAVDLMKNGWTDMAQKLTNVLKVKEQKLAYVNRRKNVNSVAGFQPIVPLYLAGVPCNMVSTKVVTVKQKVLDIVKSIDYNGSISTNTIIEESVKAMQLVKKFEAQGYRVNLYIALGSITNSKKMFAKVKIKGANEKLNVSKLAFPMVHPSMLRRLFFRFIEVHPEVTKDFVWGYGKPAHDYELKAVFPDCVIIPAILNTPVENIKVVDDLKGLE